MKIISMSTENQSKTPNPEVEVINDPNNPLYLHHSDHPSYNLATDPLNENNYHHWKRVVRVSLSAKNKFVFVTGELEKPEVGSSLEMQWKRCNSMVISWLIHSADKEIAETLLYYDTAVEIWEDLRLRFGQISSAHIYQVQKELFTISQGSSSITSYYTRFKKMSDEYLALVETPKYNKCGALNSASDALLGQQVLQLL